MIHPIGVWSGKLAGACSKVFGNGGSSLPGMVGRKLDHRLLERLAKQVDHLIFITGTNGKTTTSHLLSSILQAGDIPHIHNSEGSNMINGITSAFIQEANVFGVVKKKFAILEIDELTLLTVLRYVTPSMILVTNFFRDQLDRTGEIDLLVEKIKEAIHPLETKLLLNGDDPFSVRLASDEKKGKKKEVVYYGLGRAAHAFREQRVSESRFCHACGHPLTYDHVHFGQLGHYACSCGFVRPPVTYEVDHVREHPFLEIGFQEETYATQLVGDYNAYNVLAALACAKELGIQEKLIVSGLSHYRVTNGRMEHFTIPTSTDNLYLLNLAKNPQGVNASLSYFLQEREQAKRKQLVLFLNDYGADGKDVSWIWDADYEGISPKSVRRVVCAGSRAYDMANRLLYAGYPTDQITVIPDIEEAVENSVTTAEACELDSYYLSTYTALQQVKRALEKKGGNKACAK